MPRPRVFISHSSKEPIGEAFRQVLAQRLRDAGYLVLVDKEDLLPGHDWRPMLNAWIGGCDAAVLLVSEAALLSSYVAYESFLLSYRHTSEQGRFMLIPILLPPVNRKKVKESALSPARVEEIQGLSQDVASDVGRDKAIAEILQRLDAHQAVLDRQSEIHAKRLSGLLGTVNEAELALAADKLGVDLTPWTPGMAPALKLALGLMAAGLDNASRALRVIRSYFNASMLEEMATLIATSWVDCRSVSRISGVSETREHFALNGSSPLTAWLFVVSACPVRPSDAWRVAQVDGVMPGSPLTLEELKSRVCSALARVLKLRDSAPEAVHEELRELSDEEEPIFVVLPLSAVPDETSLGVLRQGFPAVTFFLLTGEASLSEERRQQLKNAGIELLVPPLEPGTEQPFWQLYGKKLRFLKGHLAQNET